jgi:hypothetical protein
MQITFNLPHVFNPASSAEDNAPVLRALMDALVAVNMAYLRKHPHTPPLYQSGVRYGRTVWWEPIPALYAAKLGDCKSLSAALVAQYRMAGIPARPSFRFVRHPDGRSDFHILVQTTQGFEDPSKVLGMGQDENRWFGR